MTSETEGTESSGGAVGGLGEVAFRVEDLDGMDEFYRDVVGLTPLSRGETSAFFDLGDGYGGHTQVFVLFDRTKTEGYVGIDPERTTVDHVAFQVALEDFETERERLEGHGLDLDFSTHEWVQWRSLYFSDPEDNRVEFVCYDPSV